MITTAGSAGTAAWSRYTGKAHRRSATVRIRLKFITPLLAAGVAVAAIAGAPMAAADATPAQVQQSCTNLGGTQT